MLNKSIKQQVYHPKEKSDVCVFRLTCNCPDKHSNFTRERCKRSDEVEDLIPTSSAVHLIMQQRKILSIEIGPYLPKLSQKDSVRGCFQTHGVVARSVDRLVRHVDIGRASRRWWFMWRGGDYRLQLQKCGSSVETWHVLRCLPSIRVN